MLVSLCFISPFVVSCLRTIVREHPPKVSPGHTYRPPAPPPPLATSFNEHTDISAKWIQVICFLFLTRGREKRSRDIGGCAASQNVTTKRFHCLVYTSEISFPDSYLNETILTKKAARTKRKVWEAVQETLLLLEDVISLYNVNGFVFRENTWIYTLAKRMNSFTVREVLNWVSINQKTNQSKGWHHR